VTRPENPALPQHQRRARHTVGDIAHHLADIYGSPWHVGECFEEVPAGDLRAREHTHVTGSSSVRMVGRRAAATLGIATTPVNWAAPSIHGVDGAAQRRSSMSLVAGRSLRGRWPAAVRECPSRQGAVVGWDPAQEPAG
jgi:hypothetical protein